MAQRVRIPKSFFDSVLLNAFGNTETWPMTVILAVKLSLLLPTSFVVTFNFTSLTFMHVSLSFETLKPFLNGILSNYV